MKPLATGVLLLLTLLVGIARAKLHVTHQTVVKEEQESFSVMCRDKEEASKVMWRGPKNRPLGDRTNPISRVTMHGVQLIFTKIRKEDSGVYTCMSDRADSADFEMIVAAPINFLDTPSKVVGREGSNILLKCEATDAKTEWLVDGEPPNDDSKYRVLGDGLWIMKANVSDADHQYVCKAINIKAGTFENKVISVSVTHRPRPKYAKETIVYGYIGGDVDLVCEVEAEPSPKFKWYHTVPENLIGRQEHGTTPTASVSILKIKLRNFGDMGDYKCQASNSEGTLDVIFTVLNGTAPNPPQSLDLADVSSTSLALLIEEPEVTDLENRTNMVPTGFKVEYRTYEEPKWSAKRFDLADDKIYVVGNLTKNTTYQVRAATENLAGFSEFSNVTDFATTSGAFGFPHVFSLTSCMVLFTITARFI